MARRRELEDQVEDLLGIIEEARDLLESVLLDEEEEPDSEEGNPE